jgi:hypothetical protein
MRAQTDGNSDKRRYERVRLELNARFMRTDGSEHHAQVIDVSGGGIALKSDSPPVVGEHIILYVDNLGRLEGRVVRKIGEGFALPFNATPRRRERICQMITRLRQGMPDDDELAEAGFVPDEGAQLAPISHIVLGDGEKIPVRVVDLNVTGVVVETPLKLALGTSVQVGRMNGVVTDMGSGCLTIEFEGVDRPLLLDARQRASR